MKKLGLISVVAGALTAATIGLAGPALADGNGNSAGSHRGDYGYGYGYGNNDYPWFNQLFPTVRVPQVDTSVHH